MLKRTILYIKVYKYSFTVLKKVKNIMHHHIP